MKLGPKSLAALQALSRGPLPADHVGGAVWPDRTKRGTANHGGGDYAAQMLLGRLRRAGLVRTLHRDGSSIWELTPKGRNQVTAAERRERESK